MRVRKALCGMGDCTCGGFLDERGAQSVEVVVDQTRDGEEYATLLTKEM
jgi:hypothetical protein